MSLPATPGSALVDPKRAPDRVLSAGFTRITSMRPATLSKLVHRGNDGGILRTGGGLLVEGSAEVLTVSSLLDFAQVLQNLGPDQALTFGVPRNGHRKILSRAAFERQPSADDVTTRTRDQFAWPGGAGILMLDHDPGEVLLSRDELIAQIRTAAPGLAHAQMLWWPSASSHICDTGTGKDLTDLRGQRLYLMVRDATDIPRAGAALVEHLWAAGHGHIVVSKVGAALERCAVDASVWQPERLDFAAGAVCGEGLVQRRGQPHLAPGDEALVDTRTALPDDPALTEAANAARHRAKADAAVEMALAHNSYLDRMMAAILPEDAQEDPDQKDRVRSVVKRAVDRQVLSGDFPVEIETAAGRFETVTVEQILCNRRTFHGGLTRDPLEPDYDGGRATGKLFLLDARPTLFSFARHGRSFRLIHAPRRIEVLKGNLAAATDAAIAILKDDPALFDRGGEVVLVENDTLAVLNEHSLGHYLAGSIQFWQYRKAGQDYVEADIDPPVKLVRQILSLGPRRRLKPLSAIITAPTIRPDGSVLAMPGYDRQTRLLVCLPDRIDIGPAPSRDEAARALSELMVPFESFPLVDRLARGGLLAALLSAVVRPALATAPAFGMDAPVQGSGKTLLASCVATLATGRPPEIWPHTAGRDDEEVRKRLLTALREGTTALVWDNVTGIFDSAALAAAITAPSLRDRVLGRSEGIAVPNRALLLFTGNNLCPAGDLTRRIITIRIDPRSDAPFAREFDLDPLEYVLDNRADLARAALLLIRGWLHAPFARCTTRVGRYRAVAAGWQTSGRIKATNLCPNSDEFRRSG